MIFFGGWCPLGNIYSGSLNTADLRVVPKGKIWLCPTYYQVTNWGDGGLSCQILDFPVIFLDVPPLTTGFSLPANLLE